MDGFMGNIPQSGAQAGMTNVGSPLPGPGLGQPNAGITIPMHAPKHGVGRHKGPGHHRTKGGVTHRHGRTARRRK